jgi:hypothetical protein
MKVLWVFCAVVVVFFGYLTFDMVHRAEHAGDAYDALVARYSR